jgi:lipid A 3-O-deacylase
MAVLAGAVLLVAAPLTAQAQISLEGGDHGELELGAGGYDFIGNHATSEGIFRGEYRFDTKLWELRPLLGAEITSDTSSYIYGGFALDVYFGDHWVLTPNEAVGFWSRGDHEAENLGSYVEFRSGAEFDYRFDNHSRLGVSFHHISNAGLTQRNPGEEEALVTFSLPLGDFLP